MLICTKYIHEKCVEFGFDRIANGKNLLCRGNIDKKYHRKLYFNYKENNGHKFEIEKALESPGL